MNNFPQLTLNTDTIDVLCEEITKLKGRLSRMKAVGSSVQCCLEVDRKILALKCTLSTFGMSDEEIKERTKLWST